MPRSLLLVGAASAWAAFVPEGSPYTVGNDPLSLNAGDFNGDGRPDVATINGTSSDVSVFLRQAAGGFAQEAGSPITVGSGPSGAAVGDFNGDGLADLAVPGFGVGNVSVLLRQPGGGFALEGGAAISLGASIHAVAAGDFNSDGRLDLAATTAQQPGRAPAAQRPEHRLRAGAVASRPGRHPSRSPSATTTAMGWPTWRSPTGAATA